MKLYKYVPFERLRDILLYHTIRFTQPSEFNDPFELVPRLLVPEGTVPQGRRLDYQFLLNAPRRPIEIDQRMIKDDGWCHDSHFRDLRIQLDQEIGFLSLSRTWNSLTMWAHYADGYTGAVVEFDGGHEFFEWAFDVHYTDERPIRELELYQSAPIPIAEMCDKSTDWQYENEVRLAKSLSDCIVKEIVNNIPICIAKLPPECITGVILGERVSEDRVTEVFRWIQHSHIAGNFAIPNHWDYNLVLKEFKLSYISGGREVSVPVIRNRRDFPSL